MGPWIALGSFSTVAALVALFAPPVLVRGGSCTEIRAARVLDVRSWSYHTPAKLHVLNGKIIEQKSTTPGCTVIELGNTTLIPGLIDMHTHLLARDYSYFADFSKELHKIVRTSDAQRIAWGQQAARQFLLAGITTVRDLGNSGLFLDAKLRELVEDATVQGPRLFFSGPGISGTGGQFSPGTALSTVKKEYLPVSSPLAAVRAIGRLHKRKTDWVKIFADGDPNPQEMNPQILETIVKESRRLGMRTTAHSTRDSSARRAVLAGVDSLEHGYGISESTLKLMAHKGTFLIPTDFSRKLCAILAKKSRDPDCLDPVQYVRARAERLKFALKVGVPIAFGSDVYADLHSEGLDMGQAAKETLYAYVEEGMTPKEALRSATTNSAKLLGKGQELGTLEPGAWADVIAVPGDPLSHIRDLEKVVFVMKEGNVVKRP